MLKNGIAVKAFIVNDNKLLIVKRSSDDVHNPDLWEIPGGRLSLGEDPRAGLVREVKEETNIDIEVLNPINVQHFERDDGQVITLLVFLSKPLSDSILLSDEHSDFEWISLDDCKFKLSKYFHDEVDLFKKLDMARVL